MENLLMAYAELLNETLNRGSDVYQQLVAVREEGADLIICPEHIGDSIWIATFVSDYKKTHDCEKVFLVGKDSQVDIIGRFPEVDGTIAITSDEMLDLRRYIFYAEAYEKNHIVYAHFMARFYLTAQGIFVMNISDGRMLGTMREMRRHMLGIPEDYELNPQRMIPFDDGNDEELKEMFSDAVLFCPTMQTQQGYLPDELFEDMVKKYTDAGYKCYTNYNGFEYERMIKNTTPLASSLTEFSVIAPYFKQVIAVRSGACDLLAQTGANLSVIYHPNDVMHPRNICASPEEIGQMTILDLVNRNHLAEYVYLDGKNKELTEAVFSQLEG